MATTKKQPSATKLRVLVEGAFGKLKGFVLTK